MAFRSLKFAFLATIPLLAYGAPHPVGQTLAPGPGAALLRRDTNYELVISSGRIAPDGIERVQVLFFLLHDT
jgi:hypothetical protein